MKYLLNFIRRILVFVNFIIQFKLNPMKTIKLLILAPVFVVFFSGINQSAIKQAHSTKGCVWVFTTTYNDVRIQLSDGTNADCSKNNIKGPFHIKKEKEFKYTGSGKICYRRETHVGKDKDDWGPWIKATSKYDDGREEKITIH